MLRCLLRFLLALLNIEAGELRLFLVHPADAFRDVDGRAAPGGRLVLERPAFLVEVFLGELPADAVVLLPFAGRLAPGGELALVGDGQAVEVVVLDDDVVALRDVAKLVHRAGAERPSLEDALRVARLVDLGRHVLVGQAAGRQHPGTEGVRVLPLGCAAAPLHLLRAGLGRRGGRRVQQDVEPPGQVVQRVQVVHAFHGHEVADGVLPFHVRTRPALEQPLRGRYAQFFFSAAAGAVAHVVLAPLPQFAVVAYHIEQPALGRLLDATDIIFGEFHNAVPF